MNKYHRFIRLPFEVDKPEMFNRPADSFISYLGNSVVPPEMPTWLESLGCTLSNIVEGFYSGPTTSKVRVPIHNDQTTRPGEFDAIKINKTWGPTDSVTRWYNVKDQSKLIEINHNKTEVNAGFAQAGVVPDIDCYRCWTSMPNNLELAFEKQITDTSILNVGQLHDTYNPDKTQMRWTISFTPLLDGRPVRFEEALEIFKDYIYE